MSVSSRVARLLGAGAVVASMVLSTSSAFAADPQSSDPAKPIVLSGKIQGQLGAAPVGGWAGSANRFAYYTFEYPGDERTATINLQVYPDDETIVDQTGFVIYGPKTVQNGNFMYAVGGPQPKQTPNVSANLISKDKGTYVVQVYNDSTVPIYFTIWADGLPVQVKPQPVAPVAPAAPVAGAPAVAAPAPAPAPAPAVAAPAPAAPAVAAPAAPAASATPAANDSNVSGHSFKGQLKPNDFQLFEFDYPGDESVYTVNAQIYPDDPALLDKAGIQVFQPNGTLQVKGGAQPKLRPNVSGNVISKVPGKYTVKVYNDNQNAAIDFEVSLVVGAPENKR